ncbi:MAG: pilus assembly protein [Chloroflexota bacterium]|nr:pilus assembly protein [Chloroflexota bacterium]
MKKESDQIDHREWQPALATGLSKNHISGTHISGTRINNHRSRHWERGQSMIEMAFVLPLFLALVFAIIEIGRAWSTKQSITLAAREGARVLVLPYGAGLTFSNESTQQQAAVDSVKSYMQNSGVVVTNDTQIVPVRLLPGGDSILATADDTIEQNYSGAKRGERIGIQIRHPFDSPLSAVLALFNSNTAGPSNSVPSGQIRMGVTCYLEHE